MLLIDKAYDADWPRRRVEETGATPTISSMSYRKWKARFSPMLYRQRNRIKRFFKWILQFRHIAMR